VRVGRGRNGGERCAESVQTVADVRRSPVLGSSDDVV
jgi:hypothetical protein